MAMKIIFKNGIAIFNSITYEPGNLLFIICQVKFQFSQIVSVPEADADYSFLNEPLNLGSCVCNYKPIHMQVLSYKGIPYKITFKMFNN